MKKNSLKKIILLIVSVFLFVSVYANDSGDDPLLSLDENEIIIPSEDIDKLDENSIENAFNGINTVESASTPFWNLFKLIIVLLIICILAYFVLKLLKKSKVFIINEDPYLKVVATLKLEPTNTLYVVTVGKEGFLIGVSDKNISFLSKIENTEIVDAMNLDADKKDDAPKKDFMSMLGLFYNNGGKLSKEFDQSDNGFLSRQRSRIKKSLESSNLKSNGETK